MKEKKNLCEGGDISLTESADVAMQITLQEFRTTTMNDWAWEEKTHFCRISSTNGEAE